MIEKERYATIGTWAEVFREEGVEITESVLRYRFKISDIIGLTARGSTGRVSIGGYYSESDARRVCADFFQEIPRADESGFIELNGRRYASSSVLGRAFNVNADTIRFRLKECNNHVQGRNAINRAVPFYLESDARRLFQTRVDLPLRTDSDGFVSSHEGRFGSLNALAALFGISPASLLKRFKRNAVAPVYGRTYSNHEAILYNEADARRVCDDIVSPHLQADEAGFCYVGSTRYGTFLALARLVGIPQRSVQNRIRMNTLQPLRAQNHVGRMCNFYSEDEIRRVCADLIAKKSDDR